MSYILDALQRAEAERERGRVPGLKSQLVAPVHRNGRVAGTVWQPWHAGVALAVLLLALAAWWWMGPSSAPVPLPSAPPTASTSPEPAISAAPDNSPPAPPSSPQKPVERPSPPRVAAQAILAPAPVLPVPAPPPAPAKSSPRAAAAPAPAPTAPAPTTAGPASASPTPAPAAVAPLPAKVPTFGELSPEARSQLPAVNVSGSTFSNNPSLRMLIANGKVVQEGQEVAPGLKLESIGPRSAVLNHQGLRYSIGY